MNIAKQEMQLRIKDGKHEYLIIEGKKDAELFKSELKDGEKFYLTYEKGERFDIWQQMKYYRSILNCFIPNHFNSTKDVHEYFVKKYLENTDVIDMDDIDKNLKLSKIIKNFSQSVKPIFNERIVYVGNKIEKVRLQITWYKSTASLTTKQFTNFIENIIREGSNLGIIILSSEEYKNLNNK